METKKNEVILESSLEHYKTEQNRLLVLMHYQYIDRQ